MYEDDDEALAIWRDVIGVPVERIKRMGAADNFWASGPTGVEGVEGVGFREDTGVGTGVALIREKLRMLVLMQAWREKLGCENLEGAGVVEKS